MKKRKTQGFDLIQAEVLNYLSRKGIVLLSIMFNSVLRLHYFPFIWKISINNMIYKEEKPSSKVISYRPNSYSIVIYSIAVYSLLDGILTAIAA